MVKLDLHLQEIDLYLSNYISAISFPALIIF